MIGLRPDIDFDKSVVEALRDHGFIWSDEPLEHLDPEIQQMRSDSSTHRSPTNSTKSGSANRKKNAGIALTQNQSPDESS